MQSTSNTKIREEPVCVLHKEEIIELAKNIEETNVSAKFNSLIDFFVLRTFLIIWYKLTSEYNLLQ